MYIMFDAKQGRLVAEEQFNNVTQLVSTFVRWGKGAEWLLFKQVERTRSEPTARHESAGPKLAKEIGGPRPALLGPPKAAIIVAAN